MIVFVEVSEDVAESIATDDRAEHAQRERIRRNKAYYSLDVENGLEGHIMYVAQGPEDMFERKLTIGQLYQAMNILTKKQLRRIYAYFF